MKYFTLFERITVGVWVLGLVVFIYYTFENDDAALEYSYGATGLVEVRCISGYKFAIGASGLLTQMVDSQGKVISCQ